MNFDKESKSEDFFGGGGGGGRGRRVGRRGIPTEKRKHKTIGIHLYFVLLFSSFNTNKRSNGQVRA